MKSIRHLNKQIKIRSQRLHETRNTLSFLGGNCFQKVSENVSSYMLILSFFMGVIVESMSPPKSKARTIFENVVALVISQMIVEIKLRTGFNLEPAYTHAKIHLFKRPK